MFKIQSYDLSDYLEELNVVYVRTFKGNNDRNLLGVITKFSPSFITVGLEVSLLAPRTISSFVEQLTLCESVVDVIFKYNGVEVKGDFSCTQNSKTEIKDKNEEYTRLTLSFAEVGTVLTKPNGNLFTITRGDKTTTAGYASTIDMTSLGEGDAKLNGISLPKNEVSGKQYLFVLGDTILT